MLRSGAGRYCCGGFGPALWRCGTDLADPSKASALTGLHMVTVVLRLYRQGDQETGVRCLNIIDRLAEFNLYDLERALDDER
ncbi:MAG: hypothetical protein F4X17_01710 [Gemmatimonadetes bacterium]|nr:hypothetical protein [Gemmatimonadota bacterium]